MLSLFFCGLSGCGKAEEKGKDFTSKPRKLNLGCGEDIREGYDNIDLYFPDPRVIKMDIRHLTYADNTVEEVLASHVLEHLAFRDVDVVIKEMHRVLKPEGRVFIDVPDLEALVMMWLNLPEEERWGTQSMAFVGIFGLQDHEGNFHKTGFTAARLGKVLTEAGFQSIEIRKIGSHGGPALYAKAKK